MTYVMVLFACLPNGDCAHHVLARGVASYAICVVMSPVMEAQWIAQHPEWRPDYVFCAFDDAT